MAVDGEVQATTRAHRAPGGGMRFSTLLPDGALGGGDNGLQVLEVERLENGGLALRSLSGASAADYRLRYGPDLRVEALVGERDEQLLNARIKGSIQAVELGAETVTVKGWAADLGEVAPAEELLVFHRDRLIYRGSSPAPHPGAASRLGDERYLGSGFELVLRRRDVPELERWGLRLFARSRAGGAAELQAQYQRIEAAPDGRERVVVSDGRRLPLGTGPLAGRLQQLEAKGGRLWVAGWAADGDRELPAERVILFRHGRYLRQLVPSGKRPAIARRFGPRALRCGFNTPLDLADRESLLSGQLRIIAVSRLGGAVELELPASLRNS